MPLRPSILKVVAYFDLFSYPVSMEEILFFMDREATGPALEPELDALVAERRLFRLGTFYSLQNDPSLTERRLKGNQHADELLLIAGRISRFLYQFPYVRGIGISGSLSKHYADEDADIDYFVITRSNRLWIARTFMHLFKKWSFVRGRQHWYCMNYFIDEDALEIEEKNIFTATELITLLPACGNGGLVRFFDANNWVASFLPHYKHRTSATPPNPPPGFWKRTLESLLNGHAGDRLDDFFRRLTTRRWSKKEQQGALDGKGFRMSLKTGKHYSRPNPEMLQRRILDHYIDKLKKLGLSPSSGN
ncbi:MAG: hypothetical protein J0H74_27405 [Chitinophagaceae bacterium]|nr:hypothetical protein [Chitinophagaceae bacterium]